MPSRLTRYGSRFVPWLALRRLGLLCGLLLPVALPAQDAPQFYRLATPAAPGSLAPQLVTASDGEVWMSWLEPLTDASGHRLLCAQLDPVRSRWSEPREIARGDGWFINWADTPQLAAGPGGHLAAVWYVANPRQPHQHHGSYRAWTRFSTDAGQTWSEPRPLSSVSEYNEFVSLAPLAAGEWLAVWLDGRRKHREPDGPTELYGRKFSAGAPADEERLDPRVCDCCATALATLPDGSAYAVYRDRSDGEVRDLAGMRWRDGRWSPAQGLPADGWMIAGCPVNGPALTRAGARLGLVWFTAAGDQPRLMGATSTDFGLRWTAPQPLDRGTEPLGRPGAVLVRDGSLWTSWVQADGAVALSRLAPGGEPGEIYPVTPAASTVDDQRHRATGVPRLALVARAPGSTIRLLLAYTGTDGDATDTSRVATTLITLPATAAAAASSTLAEDCGCDQNQPLEGHAVRGRIVRVLADREAVLVAHEEVPGVMGAMTMAFKVDPRLLPFLQPEQEILARMNRRDDGQWWLFGVRIVKQPPAATP